MPKISINESSFGASSDEGDDGDDDEDGGDGSNGVDDDGDDDDEDSGVEQLSDPTIVPPQSTLKGAALAIMAVNHARKRSANFLAGSHESETLLQFARNTPSAATVAADNNELDLEDGWDEVSDDEGGAPYYYHAATGATKWERPVKEAKEVSASSLDVSEAAYDDVVAGDEVEEEEEVEEAEEIDHFFEELKEGCAVDLQRVYRGWKGRRKAEAVRDIKRRQSMEVREAAEAYVQEAAQEDAAVLAQRVYRGWAVRRRCAVESDHHPVLEQCLDTLSKFDNTGSRYTSKLVPILVLYRWYHW